MILSVKLNEVWYEVEDDVRDEVWGETWDAVLHEVEGEVAQDINRTLI